MKSSRAWLTSSAWVQTIACGPPAMTVERAFFSNEVEPAEQDVKIAGQRVEVIAGARPARGAEAPPVVGDHPVPGGQQGCLLLFPRVPVQRVAVYQHDRRTGPVILVVDPDSGGILPPDGDKRHRDPHR